MLNVRAISLVRRYFRRRCSSRSCGSAFETARQLCPC